MLSWIKGLRPGSLASLRQTGRRPHTRKPRPALEALEVRVVPTGTIPLYFNAPADVVGQGFYVAITGKDPTSSNPKDQGEYFQLGQPTGGVYSGSFKDLTSTGTIPLVQLSFQSSPPPAGDTNAPAGSSWAEVDLPDQQVDSGQIFFFVGPSSPTSVPVMAGKNGLFTVAAPTPDTYPNNRFGLFELSVASNGGESYVDTSNVDSIGVPYTVQTTSASPVSPATSKGVGIQLSAQALPDQYKSFLNKTASTSPGASDFLGLQAPSMIVAPQHQIDSLSTTGPKLGLGPTSGGDLPPSTTYHYEITAVVNGTETGPGTPATLATGTAASNDLSIVLAWAPMNGASSYKVYRATSGSGPFDLLGSVTGTSFLDDGSSKPSPSQHPPTATPAGPDISDPSEEADSNSKLAAGYYWYQITAISASGETMASNYIGGSYTSANSNTFTLSWPQFAGATGYNIYRSFTPAASPLTPAPSTPTNPFTLYASSSTNSYTDSGNGTSSTTQAPSTSYTYDPLSSYFTPDLVKFFESHDLAASGSSFTLDRDGYTYTGTTTTIQDTGTDNNTHTYVVLKLNGAYNGTPPTGYPSNVTLYLYAPFFTSNYTGSNPFGSSSDPLLNTYVVPPAPQWMTDGATIPGSMVFGAAGSFNTGSDDPKAVIVGTVNLLSDVENSIDTAFNRGIAVAVPGGQAAVPPDNWADVPQALSATPVATTAGSLPSSGSLYYRITTVDSAGQSPASNVVAAPMASGDTEVTLQWLSPAPATAPLASSGYDIYRATSLNGPWTLVKQVNNPSGTPSPGGLQQYSFTDSGGGTPNQAVPTFYPADSSSNYYADFLHQSSTVLPSNGTDGVSINGLAYGFAYDDQGNQSSTIGVTGLQSLMLNFQPLGITVFPSTANLSPAATLTINGSGFDPKAQDDTVTFTGASQKPDGAGTVIAASSDGSQLTVQFTQAPSTGPLYAVVTVDGEGNSGAPVQVANVVSAGPPSATTPTALITSGPSSHTASSTARFTFTGTDGSTPASQLHYEVSLDGSTFSPSDGTSKAYTGLAPGTHTFEVEAVDPASNVSTPAAYSWTIVTPTQIVVTSGANQSTNAGTSFAPITLEALDANNNPVADVPISFTDPASGASAANLPTVVTSAAGVVTVIPTANNFAGSYTVTASTGAASTPFTLTNLSPLGNSPNATYVENVYALLLGRAADPAAQVWVNALNGGASPVSVVRDIEGSTEYLGDLVKGLYLHYLNRAPDAAGLAGWTAALARGDSIQEVTAGILSSKEYYNDQGSTSSGFVQALYQQILGRTGSAGEVNTWVNALNGGATRAQVAMGFLSSTEYHGDQVAGGPLPTVPYDPSLAGYYPQLMRRPADPVGFAYWVSALGQGVSDQAVLAAILGSAEGYTLWS